MGSDQALVLVVMVELIVPPLSGVLLLELRFIRLGRIRGEDASVRRKDLLLSSSRWDGGGGASIDQI